MLDRLRMAGHAMMTRIAQMETITNNLANINTTGFKRDGLFVNELEKQLRDLQFPHEGKNAHVPLSGTVIDLTQGELKDTGKPFDVAISGEGLFVVETPQGEAYTRDGRFTLNQEGIITTLDGYAVLGEGGNIEIDLQQSRPTDVVINDGGEILVNGSVVEVLKIVSAGRREDLQKIGENLYRTKDPNQQLESAENPVVKQGFLEESNVNPVAELVRMIDVQRAFQSDQKLLQAQDELLRRGANDISRY